MRNKINIYLIEYAINSLLRQKFKNIFILIVFTFLTALLCSIFFISNSIKYELNSTLKSLPQITVQKLKAGRHYDIDTSAVDEILNIAGVQDAVARVWGYYYFENAGVNFSVIGIDEFENQYKESLNKVVKEFDFSKAQESSSMIIGTGVKKVLDENYYKEYFNFIKPDGTFKKVNIAGVFQDNLELESNDTILLPKELAMEIFGMEENKATDIVVKVANPEEIFTVASKIKLLYPDTRVITNKELEISYQNIFDYKGGVFLALFIVSIFTFFIIIYDKASGLSSEEKKEIGILKAIGWKVEDVLKEKFYESFIISFISYILGILIAFTFVYIFNAPLLREIFTGYSQLKTSFELPFVLDFNTLFLVFFLSVPIYIAATIVPSWRSATIETDKVIR
ncbi:ABC transporter permease [Halarcobacter anaerophilus]|uniref:ABC transporter permease n=1 Tax=Halarcobacter anaerophilus TaxID=877500 RepID=A0A4Q0XYG1_9BACT|nr:FtsX-like permease family protein [Halarcobacter anaerophilus]QDF29767.1 ABC transporter, permease protein, FtsX/LolE family [Halarcobacter anaerophilus]RXJ62687.1 ABC transporter permease [Halarcobacter anaerophilus]